MKRKNKTNLNYRVEKVERNSSIGVICIPESINFILSNSFSKVEKQGYYEGEAFLDAVIESMDNVHLFLCKALLNLDIDQYSMFSRIYRTNRKASHIIRLTGDILKDVEPEVEANETGITYSDNTGVNWIELEPSEYHCTIEQSLERFVKNVSESGLIIDDLHTHVKECLRRHILRDMINAIRLDANDLNTVEITVHINKKIDDKSFVDKLLRRDAKIAYVNIRDVKVFINFYKITKIKGVV